ncbi:MAG: transglutaminase domain-containing protein [Verrucomicrobia bacterium]|nr:transglutaminase domain-containing protein [Verrucomicrobiota bacterium]
MRTPPLLLGATLLFWGWQSDHLLAAAVMATLLEGARITPVRWEFSDKDFDRLWNFCTVLFLAAALYAFTSNQGPSALVDLLRSPSSLAGQKSAIDQTLRATLVFTQWLPMVFFTFMAAQAYSRRDTVDLSAFSLLLRWRRGRAGSSKPTPRPLNISYPCFALCLASACIGGPENVWFYPGLCVLLGWALWPERSRRVAWPVWGGVALVAAGLGFAGQRGLYRLHGAIQDYNPDWLSGLTRSGFDPKESRTSLGQVGRLKQSGKIVWRVTPKDSQPAPALLREASYRAFRSPVWHGAGAEKDFAEVPHAASEGSWELLRKTSLDDAVTIGGYLHGGRGLLPLPNGTARLENLPVFLLRTNRLGAVRVEAGPGLVIFDAHYGPGATIDGPPGEEDLQVPEKESAAVSQVAAELKLGGRGAPEVLRAVADFLAAKFRYSLWCETEPGGPTDQTPLASFLLHERAGHCEFFATATVLLLRQAGIPARYAVGYAVQEPAGKGFVVRQRHAHAWCLAYIEGTWQDFDTTPPSWFETEAQSASLVESLSDAWSRLWFEFTKLRYGQSGLRRYVWWIVGPVLALSLGQVLLRKQWRRARHDGTSADEQSLRPGLDSEFYLVETALSARGIPRQPGEAWTSWLKRVRAVAEWEHLRRPLSAVLRLHSRYRFDPAGLSAAERRALRTEAEACLARLTRQPREDEAGDARRMDGNEHQ